MTQASSLFRLIGIREVSRGIFEKYIPICKLHPLAIVASSGKR